MARLDTNLNLSQLEEEVLTLLNTCELYGLQIIMGVEQATGGKRKIGFGSLYPTLHKLERKGLVKARWGEETPEERGGARRKYYKITGAGKVALNRISQIRAGLARWKPAFGEA